MAEEQQKIVTTDWVDDAEEKKKVELHLPRNLVCEEQRETANGWAATFRYLGMRFVLRERESGTIECDADWVRTLSGRRRTGTHRKKEAIEWAIDRLIEAHIDSLAPAKGDRSRGNERVLEFARAVWGDDLPVQAIDRECAEHLYGALERGSAGDERPAVQGSGSLNEGATSGGSRPGTLKDELAKRRALSNKLSKSPARLSNPLRKSDRRCSSDTIVPDSEGSPEHG